MADQQVIDTGTAPNAGDGDSLYVAFTKVNDNFSNVWDAGPVGSNVTISNNTISVTDTNGNLVLKPNGIGVIQVNNSVIPWIDGVYSLGSVDNAFRQGYFDDLTVSGNLSGNIDLSNVGSIGSSGNITAAGNIEGDYILGNGSQLTGLPDTYNDANVVNLLASFGSNSIVTTGNITGGIFYGDGGGLSNLQIVAGSAIENGTSNVRVTENGNVTVSIAGISAVATFTTDGLTVPGTVTAGNVEGNGAALTSTFTDRGNDPSNWDALGTMGIYKVNRTSWSGTTGTPLDSTVYVGLLQVLTSNDTTTQIFYPGSVDVNDAKIQWNRTYWSGVWTDWIKIVNNGQTIDAGSY